MPPFPKPKFVYDYDLAVEVAALRQYEQTEPGRAVPPRQPDRLLIATWNIANLGVQERREKDYRLLAEIVGWFDLIAIQEVADELIGLRSIYSLLPATYRMLVSDPSGNRERQAFLYDSAKVRPLEKVGRLSVPPSELRHIKLPDVVHAFQGFDRGPYMAAFQAGTFRFLLVNVHLFFGSDRDPADIDRRRLETFAIARWADLRRKSAKAFTHNIVPLGDFNLPRAVPGDPIYSVLTSRGLQLPDHSTQIGSSIASESHYDQIAFFPGETKQDFTGQSGVFDFDGALFGDLWESRGRTDFLAYSRYYVSDHRPLWAEFRI
jgi:endonuclease/exonuclease/phosphatase family metal-dependent hydrolase